MVSVLHSGDYYLFETDSEEDEESVVEDQKPPKQSAFQVRGEVKGSSPKSPARGRVGRGCDLLEKRGLEESGLEL